MKTVLITGASGGIGAAAAKRFAAGGYRLVLNYNTHYPKELISELASVTDVIAVKADITVASEVKAMVEQVKKTFGHIHVLVNNSGVSEIKLFTDITESDWDKVINVNLKGAYLVTREVIPDMIKNREGKIINVSSMWGLYGASCEVHYSASKAGLIGFTKALSKEVGLSCVNVNCVCPGLIDTPINANIDEASLKSFVETTSLNRIGKPEDVANAIFFLASEEASYITGQVLSVDGGI